MTVVVCCFFAVCVRLTVLVVLVHTCFGEARHAPPHKLSRAQPCFAGVSCSRSRSSCQRRGGSASASIMAGSRWVLTCGQSTTAEQELFLLESKILSSEFRQIFSPVASPLYGQVVYVVSALASDRRPETTGPLFTCGHCQYLNGNDHLMNDTNHCRSSLKKRKYCRSLSARFRMRSVQTQTPVSRQATAW